MSSTACPFPVELLRHTLSFVSLSTDRTATQTLYSFSLSSKLFFELAKEELYKSPCLIGVPSHRFISLTETLRENEDLRRHVKALKVKIEATQRSDGPGYCSEMEILRDLLKLCPNLEELHLKSMSASYDLYEILAIPKKLRTLYLDACRFRSDWIITGAPSTQNHTNSITSLSIASCHFDHNSLHANMFTSLKALSLSSRASSVTNRYGLGQQHLFDFLRTVPTKLTALRLHFDDYNWGGRAFATQNRIQYLEVGRAFPHPENKVTDVQLNLLNFLHPTLSVLRVAQRHGGHSAVLDILSKHIADTGATVLREVKTIEIVEDDLMGTGLPSETQKEALVQWHCTEIGAQLVAKKRDRKNQDRNYGSGEADEFFRSAFEDREYLLRGC